MQTPIAVVGVSALFPGSSDGRGFWSDILAGRDLVTEVPPSHWLIEDYYDPDPAAPDKTYCKRGAFLSPVDFDPMEFGVPPSIVPATDTAQILALIVAQKVLDDASQGQFASMNRDRISVLLGVTSAQELLGSMVSRLQRPVWIKALRESGIAEAEAQAICDRMAKSYVPWQEASFPGLLGNVVAGRIANRFDLRGTNAVVDAACASSLAAVSMGINELELGQSDLVIAGGVDTMNDIFMYLCFSKTPALSPTGDCRPFSDGADGTLLGEGMAMFALKRLADAERDGDRVYAVIRGLGSASDGRSKSVYAPLPEGQGRALRRAYQAAGFGPETVELVEAHGTGTKAGDAAEFEGLSLAFRESGRSDPQWCALGSVKSQIGHTKAAAGAAGLFKAIMALHHKVLPPTIKIERPNPKFAIERSPFYLNTHARPWIRDGAHPRRAAVSSFGFGGSNFHVALEEYAPAGAARPAFRLRTAPTELVLLGARDAAGLVEQCRRMAARPGDLAQAARASQLGFRATEAARLALCAANAEELSAKLLQAAAAIEKSPETPLVAPTGIFYSAAPAAPGRVAFVFPGQGSQYVGMGADVAMSIDAARAAWDRAAAHTFDGRGVHQVVFPAPVFTDGERDAQGRALTATEWAQPALAMQSAAFLRVLSALGVRPDCVAGHSFGEVTALHAAGALDEATLVRVARRRGELMREAASIPGSMTAVARPIDEVRAVLTEVLGAAGGEVAIANHNAPDQVVLSGATDAIARVEEALAARRIPAKRLTVATAFHSPLVAGSSAPFLEYLHGVDLAAPEIDVYGCADAMPYPRDPETVRRRLAAQLAQPVRFVEQIEAMYASGVRTFVEVGAGSVLSELIDRILGAREHRAIHLDRKGRHGLTSLQFALGRLAVAGVSMKFSVLWDDLAPPVEAPAKKQAMSIPVSGVNQGKPYPPAGGAKELPPPNAPRHVEPPAPRVPLAAAAPSERPPEPPARAMMETPSAPPRRETDGEWLRAYQEAQRQTAEAHAAYQRAMADSHMAFLRTAETSFAGLSALLGGQPIAAATSTIVQQPAEAIAMPAVVASPVVGPAAVAPVSTPIVEHMRALQDAPAPHLTNGHARPAAPVAPESPRAAAAPAAAAVDLEALMMSVVADKTGYPAEMLGAHMDMEADLGIDSIKRVEILAAFRERAPGLPEVEPTELGRLRTLGQIVEHMRALQGAPASPPATTPGRPAAPEQPRAAAEPAAAAVDLEALMMSVVADKTGYPAEMLGAHMDMEADLGIDSIKRVEILAAFRERAPGLPEVEPTELGRLRTLGQIVEHMRAAQGAPASAPATTHGRPAAPVAPEPPRAAAAAAAAAVDLEALMMSVVADKTGYPAEMLGAHMDMEADLGIDSIKRVEILAAFRERAPGLPEVEPTELGRLRTLGQIVEHMRAAQGAPASPPANGQAGAAAVPVQVGAAPASAAPAIARRALREVPATAVGLAPSGLHEASEVVVTEDGGGLAALVVEELCRHGVKARVASEVPPGAGAVIFLGGLREIGSIDDAIAVDREAFHTARTVAARFEAEGGLFVTVQDTGGDFGLSGRAGLRAWSGGLSALARTAALEWPHASVRAIDCERGSRSAEAMAHAIVEEVCTGGVTPEVGLHADGRRTTLALVEAGVAPDARPRIGAGSVVVASGGGRGVTAAGLVALARACRPRIVLLGRTPLPAERDDLRGADELALKREMATKAHAEGRALDPAEISARVARVLAQREIRATLDAIEAAGSAARYLAVDVQDADAIGTVLDGVRREWGPVTALVHGAGVIADKRIIDKTDEQFDRVFDTKVAGLRALLSATARDPLAAICVYSSIAARTGNLGQCDYAMANEVLNLVAAAEGARRGAACAVRAIGWGPWAGGMVTPSLEKHFVQMGVPLIPLDAGARLLVDELQGGAGDVTIVVGGAAGSGPLGAEAARPVSLDLRVDAASHPYLADHRIARTAVVPVAIAIEWIVRGALAVRPDLACASVHDVKVLRPLKLERFDRGGDLVHVRCRQVAGDSDCAEISVELRGRGDALHYRAVVGMARRPPAAPPPPAPPPLEAFDAVGLYDGHMLFHGPRFQVILDVEGISGAGIAGTLQGGAATGWPEDGWRTDPALLDGGLQLAVVWARHVLGGASLPMAVRELRSYREGLSEGPVRCVVSARETREARAVSDVVFTDASGAVVAELLGVETVKRPDANGAVVAELLAVETVMRPDEPGVAATVLG